MFKQARLAFFAAAAGSTFGMAGGPPPMYVVVEKVVLEPSESAPNRIQISGSFVRAKGESIGEWAKPERGYLYLAIKPGTEAESRAEWREWQKAAGTGKPVMVGGCWSAAGFLKFPIHQPKSKTDKTDDFYPTGQIMWFGRMYYDRQVDGVKPVVDELMEFAKRHMKANATSITASGTNPAP